VYIIKKAPLRAFLYLISRRLHTNFASDDIQGVALMIYNSFGIDDIHGYAVICEDLILVICVPLSAPAVLYGVPFLLFIVNVASSEWSIVV